MEDQSVQDARAHVSPDDIKVKRHERTLVIRWKDGSISSLPMSQLRTFCPCALCRQDQEKPSTSLPILQGPPPQADPIVTGAKLVGNYALSLSWSDGHDTGIYDYAYLRWLADRNEG